MARLDPRLIRLTLDIDGVMRQYGGRPEESADDLAISVSGTKFANPNQGQCTVQITNLNKSVRDFLLTEGSPLRNDNRNRREIRVEVGRVSTGLNLLYIGGIFLVNVTQPPDQTITIQCLTKQFEKSDIVTRSFSGNTQLRVIAQQVADDINATLDFQATDRQIANYSYSGSATKQINKIGEVIGVDVYIDNEILVVVDSVESRGRQVRELGPTTGLVGIPQPIYQGIKVTMLYDQQTNLGSLIELKSVQYATYNGFYFIYKLSYQLTNRDTPFYLIAECRRFNPNVRRNQNP